MQECDNDAGINGKSIEDFERGEWLGNGSFCDVFHCTDRSSGESYAMKIVQKRRSPVDQAYVMELHCLQRLSTLPSVVSLFWSFDTHEEWVGILEYCDCELWAEVRHCGCVVTGEAAWYARQIVEAVAVIHEFGIVHRDLKCENFMMVLPQGHLRLIDFGSARDSNHREVEPMMLKPQYEHHVGTPNFMSPEAITGHANDWRSDLWSVGCTVAQLIMGVSPFNAPTPYLILAKARSGNPWLPQHGILDEQRDFIKQLVKVEPDDRLGVRSGNGTRALLLHPFLAAAPKNCPSSSPLAIALKYLGRVIVEEADAAIALEDAEEVAAAGFQEGAVDCCSQENTAISVRPGEPTAQFLEEIHSLLEQETDVSAAQTFLNFCQTSMNADHFSEGLGQLLVETDLSPTLALSLSRHLQRFGEQDLQRRLEAKETFTFGEDSNADSEMEGIDPDDAQLEFVDIVPGIVDEQKATPAESVAKEDNQSRRCCPFRWW